MSATTSIQWTDKSWNPVRGCSVISPGCHSCYAMKFAHRFSGSGQPYEGLTKQTKAGPQWTGQIRLVEEALTEPLRWRKPQRIFVNSMSDLFHEDVPDAFIDRVFAVMALAPRHTFQILTKRAARMREYVTTKRNFWNGFHDLIGPSISTHQQVEQWCRENGITRAERERRLDIINDGGGFEYGKHRGWPLPNVWLGVSCEDQPRADERIPLLLQTPAAVRFISAEPLIGPINLKSFIGGSDTADDDLEPEDAHCVRCGCVWEEDTQHECPPGFGPRLDWVIVGGESGPSARPCAEDWVRSILAQCRAAAVPVFVKQLGSNSFTVYVTDKDGRFIGGAGGFRPHKGGDMAEWPRDLRVREFPHAIAEVA